MRQLVNVASAKAITEPSATEMNRRGRALMMRMNLGGRWCERSVLIVVMWLPHRAGCPEQPHPPGTLVHEARQIHKNQAGGRRLDLRIGRHGFALGKYPLTVGQDEVLKQQRRVRVRCAPE